MHDGPLGRHSALQLNAASGTHVARVAHGGVAASGPGPLGFIVPNHALRRSAYAVAARTPGVHILTGARVTRVATLGAQAELDYVPADDSAASWASPRR